MSLTAFVPIAPTDLDYSSPADNDLFAALRDCNDHSRQALYDIATHKPVKAHDHDGRNSARIATTSLPNLIFDGHPTQGWTLTGATHSANGLVFSAPSQRASHALIRSGLNLNDVFGLNGCELRVALVARIVGTLSDYELEVGFANAHLDPGADSTQSFTVSSGLTTSWSRHHGLWAAFLPHASWTRCSVSIATSGAWTGGGSIGVDYVLVRPGPRLSYWVPAYSEPRFAMWAGVQGGDAPLYETALNFTDATLEAVS